MTAWWKTLGSPVLNAGKVPKEAHRPASMREVESQLDRRTRAKRDEVLIGLLEMRKRLPRPS